jgi:hypothetical protein
VADFQLKDTQTEELKVWPSGKPMMGVMLELKPEPCTRVRLWAEDQSLMQAIAKAVKATGADDVKVGGYLAVTLTDYPREPYQAEYSKAAPVPVCSTF